MVLNFGLKKRWRRISRAVLHEFARF